MSIGLIVWIVLTVCILGFMLWSVQTQLRQKAAWRAFAKKFNLTYSENKFFEAPSFEGYLNDHYVKLYESQEFNNVGKAVKRITVEIDLNKTPDPECVLVVTSRDQQRIFNSANLPEKINIKEKQWDQTNPYRDK